MDATVRIREAHEAAARGPRTILVLGNRKNEVMRASQAETYRAKLAGRITVEYHTVCTLTDLHDIAEAAARGTNPRRFEGLAVGVAFGLCPRCYLFSMFEQRSICSAMERPTERWFSTA